MAGPDDIRSANRELSAAEIGALAHLYRGEVYRSTIWRTRLDTSTNWSVVTLGVALSITFSAPNASPIPLLLVGVLIFFFLAVEARRYRYFNVWRARCRWLETNFYAPMLDEGDLHLERDWQRTLAQDYLVPEYHIGYLTSLGRRIRRSYIWILLIQTLAFVGKLMVHPTPVESLAQFVDRAAIGPIPGKVVLGAGVLYCAAWAGIGAWTYVNDGRRAAKRRSGSSMG